MTVDEWISKAEDGILQARHFIEVSSNDGEIFVMQQELEKLETTLKLLRAKKVKLDIENNYGMRIQ